MAKRLINHVVIFKRSFNTSYMLSNKIETSVGESQKSSKTMTQDESDKTKSSIFGTRMYSVNSFDKVLLVWLKRYPSIADVPNQVPQETIVQVYSRARVRICNIMIAVAAITFLLSALTGKREASSGHTLVSDRQKWFESLKKEKPQDS